MSSRAFKDRFYEQLARVGHCLGSPRRLELLELLAQGERSVEELAQLVAATTAATSHHLIALRQGGLAESRKAGLHVFYRLADESVFDAVRAVRTVAERRLAEVERVVREHFEGSDDMDAVTRKELLQRMRDGEVVVIDVRPATEYRAGHVPGAISAQMDDLPQLIARLPKTKEVVAYCRGPYCVFAHQAVALLRKRGRKARRLEEGLPEWRAAGLPVEVSAGGRSS